MQRKNDHMVFCSVGCSQPIEFMVDSGSDWNLVSPGDWRKLRAANRGGQVALYGIKEKPGEYASSYASSAPLEASRHFHAYVGSTEAVKPKSFAKFYVVDNGGRSILSRETAIQMELLQVGVEVQKAHCRRAEVGVVCEQHDEPSEPVMEFPFIPDFIFDFDVDQSVTPSVRAYVNIPEAYKEPAVTRLRKMESQGIIERVTTAPRWISGLSAVPKGKDDFRLVVNMVGPNRAIRRRFYKMPTMESIRTKLHGAKWFTKLDLTSAFHHVKLGEASKELTTFLGPDGMYRFNRLNFGVSSAPEGFQQKMEEILQGIKNVVVYVDDILVYAEDLRGLRLRTNEVLQALSRNNLTLNGTKCEYEKERLEFLGHELSAEGFNIARKKVEDVAKFRAPRTTTELKSFLGLASFLSTYIKDFADLTKPLWDATAEGQFAWEEEQQQAFGAVKEAIMNCTVRQGFFSTTDATYLYTDASEVAVSAVLTQKDEEGKYRIIAFASKLLTATERRYAQTQREALGIVWGVEHFWYYLLGRKFAIRTDAQGISFIMKRDHTQTKRIMSRADAWALRLEGFDYDVEFVRGTENIADPSSRLLEGIGSDNFEDRPSPGEIMSVELKAPGNIAFGAERVTLEEVRWHAERDDEAIAVRMALETGEWPRTLGKFKSVRHELRLKDGMITRMGETFVPRSLRPKVLTAAHSGHPGASAMKSLLRGTVWWPGSLAHAERWVASCEPCALMSRRTSPMPMQRSELPGAVWENVALDYNGPFAQYGGIYILLMVDRYSRFLIARPVKSTDFGSLRTVLEDIFDTYGTVRSCMSDNGPPFFGAEYNAFCATRGIEVKKSTPLDAQQNGGVEIYMKLVNKGMAAPSVEGGSWRRSLENTMAAHNAATCVATGVAPDVLMFGRKVRRNLPLLSTEAEPAEREAIRRWDWSQKMAKKRLEDAKRSAKYAKIEIGDKVYVSRQTKGKGQTTFDPTVFTVIGKNHGTLQLLSPNGNIMLRTVTFVRKVPSHRELTAIETGGSDEEAVPLADPVVVQRTGVDAPSVAAGQSGPRRSGRDRNRPAHLKDYVGLLQWELESSLRIGE